MKAQSGIVIGVVIVLALLLVIGLYYAYSPTGNVIDDGDDFNNNTNEDSDLGDYRVYMANLNYSPANLTINKGETVVWENFDSVFHTVTSDVGRDLNSSNLSRGQTFYYTFNSAGTFTYHSSTYPAMSGTIIVRDTNSSVNSATTSSDIIEDITESEYGDI